MYFPYTGQIANYVNNGGFEDYEDGPSVLKVPTYWAATNPAKFYGKLFSRILPPYSVPNSFYAYQWPRHGNNYFGTMPYCVTCGNFSSVTRGYPRNKLKDKLEPGKTYCFSMYVNLTNRSSYAISQLGAYFSDVSSDTIKYCTTPITYLIPQIENPVGHILSDTLNWTLIRGTFIANGTEEYLIIGNFNSDSDTDTLFVNPAILPDRGCDYFFDDISCIDIELPAFAGNDNSVVPGDSIFIGREPDVGIDEACMWYKLPMVITPTTPAIDTVAGMWVKPTETTTYVVKQDICGNIKWDTVVIYKNPVGIEKLRMLQHELQVYPVPASNYIELKTGNQALLAEFRKLTIINSLGQVIREEDIDVHDLRINIEYMPPGSYSLRITNLKGDAVNKRFLVVK